MAVRVWFTPNGEQRFGGDFKALELPANHNRPAPVSSDTVWVNQVANCPHVQTLPGDLVFWDRVKMQWACLECEPFPFPGDTLDEAERQWCEVGAH